MENTVDSILHGERLSGIIRLQIGQPQNLVPKMLFPRQKMKRPRGSATHCRNGHERTEENTYVPKKGGKVCIDCRHASHERQREVRRKLKEAREG